MVKKTVIVSARACSPNHLKAKQNVIVLKTGDYWSPDEHKTPATGDSFIVEYSVAGLWRTCFLILFLVGPALIAGEGQAEAMQDVSIENAWVRAMPPSQPNTAAYMTLRNDSDRTLKIIGARSEPIARVEIHTSREVDGMVRMEQLEQVTVAPGQLIVFAPGGMHLMMLGLKKMPAAGEQVKLCLEFKSGASVCAGAEVRRVAPPADEAMSQDMHHNHH